MPKTKKFKGSAAIAYLADQDYKRLKDWHRSRAAAGPVKTTRIEDLAPEQREKLGL